MPLLPVACGTYYGIPTDVDVECTELVCVGAPVLVFVLVRVLVMYDVGRADGLVIREFLFVHVRHDGEMLGMLQPPPPDAPYWV
ncbi:hypothetical protein EUGRSUZ_A01253 [Eucalyptus grandis]|uniref:Uncharacterized protein n=2 Tax=Eucalyptus grandis TaxID=71139 RepID=A0ACC3M243_EUCGR|nr:hypothetical protein EUGRSUZ_A01253 [Eucalyptus grandis]